MDAFAAANDLLFEDGNLSLSAVWRSGALGTGTPCRIVLRAPDQEMSWRENRMVVGTVLLEVRLSDVPALTRGDSFEADGAEYVVTGDPLRDELQLTWRAEARRS